MGNANDRIPLFNSYKIYKDKCLFALNESSEWNVKKLPNNTLKLQLKNVDEKVNKLILMDVVDYAERKIKISFENIN